jgi:hypothetical protein
LETKAGADDKPANGGVLVDSHDKKEPPPLPPDTKSIAADKVVEPGPATTVATHVTSIALPPNAAASGTASLPPPTPTVLGQQDGEPVVEPRVKTVLRVNDQPATEAAPPSPASPVLTTTGDSSSVSSSSVVQHTEKTVVSEAARHVESHVVVVAESHQQQQVSTTASSRSVTHMDASTVAAASFLAEEETVTTEESMISSKMEAKKESSSILVSPNMAAETDPFPALDLSSNMEAVLSSKLSSSHEPTIVISSSSSHMEAVAHKSSSSAVVNSTMEAFSEESAESLITESVKSVVRETSRKSVVTSQETASSSSVFTNDGSVNIIDQLMTSDVTASPISSEIVADERLEAASLKQHMSSSSVVQEVVSSSSSFVKSSSKVTSSSTGALEHGGGLAKLEALLENGLAKELMLPGQPSTGIYI